MAAKFPTLNGVTPYDNVADGRSPRGAFQVFAQRKYGGDGIGAQLYRGSFHSLSDAQTYAEALAQDADYYSGYEWVQVGDMMHGEVWNLEGVEWVQVQEADSE